MTIRRLPAHVARLIAAGEVVSRPLDVVREGIDNALDAGATRLELEVQGGGLELLRLRDNGVGIPAEELTLAVERHATSKLSPEHEANLMVSTLGFRGEALWAIAQAGVLRLTSRPPSQLGALSLLVQGEEQRLERSSAPAGTTVEVSELFAHLPARRRTQASAAAEVREITALLGRYVLHWPQLHWRLLIDGETRLLHAPSDHRGAVASVYGPLTANRLMQVKAEQVAGVISRPELTRPRRDRLHFSVNGRPIQAPQELERAVIEAYAELLPSGQAPLAVLDLRVPPEQINPNVHPAKQVVAFAQLGVLAEQVRQAVSQALAAQPLVRPAPALRLPGVTAASAAQSQFPELHYLGLYQELYILAQAEGDLWLIDGHAAHERVLYEQLQAQVAARAPLELPEPELLTLNPEQRARLHERAAELRAWGLVIEDFGAGLARLRALPAALAALPVPRLHEQLIEQALGQGHDPQRQLLSTLACAPALRAGHFDSQRAQQLLSDLAHCGQPWSCPHGRPTTLRLSERDLAHAFGRRSPRDLAQGRDLTDELVVGLEEESEKRREERGQECH